MSFSNKEDPKTLVLFDVDGTLTPARLTVSDEMRQTLKDLRKKVVIGFVGGSDLSKQVEQLGDTVLQDFDYCFSENGLTAYKEGKKLASQSFINWIGEEKYNQLAKFILRYLSELDLPIRRGTFIEFRNGMINVSPVGRNASTQERNDYEKFDKEHNIRTDMVAALKKEFSDLALTYSIGGQISFDVFPTGWDKTYCLQHVQDEGFETIHFFGDKAYKGGNDWEIYSDERTIGHSVSSPEDTIRILKELFSL
ncbi:Phosphomannomutase [Komagataella phaffii CBS 7435]|uniref:Phosphomannomutase n=2 Tax=Komagataella phaffii TaxID=460519 RepID=C4R306_KOMPG|nr:Phosphomannomutase, involved in synthesis of GDP-mannose and dolichol-phosphate-mannose [Komagataella phaffii GS115]KAI0462318.1 Phosphomannomutase 1 [Komagataella kurtzmanii]CAH2447561.1 Phosphomannomutase [Komagataella phaffii CBS 7435]CAY69880.1 Phosphomannomutase, involved in synthesis of GDP-mannose and dolichol-phosphate-mannose [Komagataella phaffii GS115]CCA37752.1 Phosphomannomutase [Komagataella phaffii CBS 7435]